MSNFINIPGFKEVNSEGKNPFPLNQWYVAGFSWQLKDKPVGRTILNEQIVFFNDENGKTCAIEDRCVHRFLPLSEGTLDNGSVRCGYHGMLFDGCGKCTEIPGQEKIPRKAKVKAYNVEVQNDIIWIWFGDENNTEPNCKPPIYEIHSNKDYVYGGDVVHYDVPYQLIHDNLLDLSHLGYVHLVTIGGDASTHMNADMKVSDDGKNVKVTRYMLDSMPPPTYLEAYPFQGKVNRWQEIEFCLSHLKIWTGAVDVDTDDVEDPNRGGFHMRGFHGITPETETSCHYFWTMASNPTSNIEILKEKLIDHTARTFHEDKVIIEDQYQSMLKFPDEEMIDIHVDLAPNRARRIIESLR